MKARSIRRCMAHLLFAELVPELFEIGLLPLKDFAKLLNALLHFARGAFAGFENERRRAAQIKRHKRLEQVFAIQFARIDRKSTRLNSSHGYISYAVFCLKKKNNTSTTAIVIRNHQTAYPAL